ncbi:MAG: polymer-forming cytoskeletal protein [Defluviitaleaceae bacterium]|nr:polymer-forming cytoskeletal protein [Defluviitaleaceae bacterium]
MKFRKSSKEEPISAPQDQGSILCEGLIFKDGNLTGDGKITINCHFVGDIKISDTVYIGEAGCILGNIEAKSIIITGEVKGNIEAVNNVVIRTGGILNGNIKCSSLEISSGAAFSGECNMTASKKENSMLYNMSKNEVAKEAPRPENAKEAVKVQNAMQAAQAHVAKK